MAHRAARDPASDGVGVTVSLSLRGAVYVVAVERYKDVGGFGQKLSREEKTFDSITTALAEVARHGFTPDHLKF